jgi:ATP-binding cassette subfamily B protein
MLAAPVLSAFYDFGNNYALKLVVDAFSENQQPSYHSLALPIAIFVGAQILIDIVWRGADIAEWRAEPYVRQALLNEVFWYVEHHPYQFFQNTPSGTITSRIKGILDGYDNFWASMHHDFTPRIASVVVLTAVVAIVNVKVCLLLAAWTLCFVAIMYKFSITLDRLSFKNANDRHSILGLIADNIANILTVFSFATRKEELKRLNNEIENSFIPSSLSVYRFSFWSNIVAGLMYWIMLVSLFLFMIHLRLSNQATSGDVVFVMGITLKMSMELWQMVQRLQNFMKNIGDFKSAFSILQMPHDSKDKNDLPALVVNKPDIKFEHLSFSYSPHKPVFSDLNLIIKPNEKVGLVGVSGSGKSTLVSLMLKYFYPEAGRILIDGQDIANCSADSVRQNIAVIPQDIVLFHRSVKENILYGCLSATDKEIYKAAQMANIHDFILSLPEGYLTKVGERGLKLSGGQRQRIAIARAFLKKAKILILDEATSSLDTETEQLIQTSLNNILYNDHMTVVAIAHRLSTLKHMDRIIVLEKGKIIEEGTHNELLLSGKLYKKLWEMQQHI